MTGWEMFFFVAMVVGAVVAVVAIVWLVRWRRNPEAFRQSWKRTPMPGSPNHWNRPSR